MADNTKIEWTDATWNPVNGCSLASPGCTNCYAMKQAHRVPQRRGLTQHTSGGMVWTGEVRFDEAKLTQPLHWKRPRRIFVCAHGDLFHDAVPDEWIDRVFAVMAICPQHTFQVLTKRSARMRRYFDGIGPRKPVRAWMRANDDIEHQPPFPLPNVWLGVSVEDQRRADERIPDLLATPAAVRWLSCEPLLGPVDLVQFKPDWGYWLDNLDWVVAGGESGPGARPMHPDWARTLRDQCAAAGVPFFFKQWGDWSVVFDRDRDDPDWRNCSKWDHDHPKGRWLNLEGGTGFHGDRVVYVDRIGKRTAGRLLDGIEHNDMPGEIGSE